MFGWTRRQFLASGAAAALWPRSIRAAVGSALVDPTRARPFPPGSVRLSAGPLLDAAEVNRRYLAGLDTDRLLHTFRLTAGLPTAAEPLGGWEAPENELRGHFTGHYLSACALVAAGTGDAALAASGRRTVAGLAECQKALGSGYLSAFPEEFFDRLRAGENVWAPFYTLHKIMAGLFDQWTLGGNAEALEVLRGMAEWTCRWASPLDDAAMARVLEREYGGMNELLYSLAAATGEASYRELAHRFDHDRIFVPLAAGRDELRGLHVNTQIPKIIGAARRYETTGDPQARAVASYFWTEVTSRRSYATGGTSNEEEWRTDPGQARLGARRLHAGVLLHVQHAEADAPRLRRGPPTRPAPTTPSARSSTGSSERSIPPTAPSSTTFRSAPGTGSTSERPSPTSGAARAPAPSPSRSSPRMPTSTTPTASGSTSSSPRSCPGPRRAWC